jgi:ABC-2 type transport system ATP-binding protein
MHPTQEINSLFASRLALVKQHYQQNDTLLGFKQLLNCGLDTGNHDIFRLLISYTDWFYNHENETNPTQHFTQVNPILKKMLSVGVQPSQKSEPTIIIAENIEKKYSGGNFTLGPVSITLERGKMIGLVGENGNGKTTLLRILAQELTHDAGNIIYHLPYTSTYHLRTLLAYIPQRTPTWHGSLMDNLQFTLSSYGIFGIANELETLMIIARMGLWKYKSLQWNQLSSGYKMRFELARTLLRKPDVLLLDEPLANLDILSQQTILDDLKSIGQLLSHPISIILSSQQLYEVEKNADNVLFLKQGKPMWQYNTSSVEEFNEGSTTPLIIELQSKSNREDILATISHLGDCKITNNGGVFIIHFDACVTFQDIFKALGNSHIEIDYVRNISKSTRRFFTNA